MISVVATDSSGASVSGLQPSDFLLKMGREEVPPEKAEEVRPFVLPPDKSGHQQTPVFLIIDKVVPAAPDVVRSVERPAVRFLARSLQSHEPVTLLTMDANGLHLVHSFDTPAPVLAAALQLLDRKTHILGGHFKSAAASNVPDNLKEKVGDELAALEQLTAPMSPVTGDPFPIQMEALYKFGNLCRGMHGRKPAIWITGFPAIYSPTGELVYDTVSYISPHTDEQRGKDKEYESAIEALNEGEVSIFPVTTWSFLPYAPNVGVDPAYSGPAPVGPGTPTGDRDALLPIAKSTGGDILFLGPHIASTIRPRLSHFSSYYLLSYRPSPIPREIEWTKLDVKTKREGVRVHSMDGFFALP